MVTFPLSGPSGPAVGHLKPVRPDEYSRLRGGDANLVDEEG
jgi:hypothetical protein